MAELARQNSNSRKGALLVSTALLSVIGSIASATDNTGTLVIPNGDSLLIVDDLNNTGSVDNNGTLTVNAGIVNDGTFRTGQSGTTSTTTVDNDADMVNKGQLTASGGVDNSGSFINDGTITGNVVNTADGTFQNGIGAGGQAGTIDGNVTNTGLFINDNRGTNGIPNEITGNVTNGSTGTLVLATTTIGGGLFNSGDVEIVGGAVNIDGFSTNSAGISLVDGATGGSMSFGGGLFSNGGTYALDIDLLSELGTADFIDVASGATTGTVELALTPENYGGLQSDPILLFNTDDTAANAFTATMTGLPDVGGTVVYGLVNMDDTMTIGAGDDIGLIGLLNPAIGGLVGGITMSQDFVNTVVNRPTSPFVSNAVTGDACAEGYWGRVKGGTANLSGNSELSNGSKNSTDISADYAGVTLGWDAGCFDGRYNGADLAFGVTIGYQSGSTKQDNLEPIIDPDTGLVSLGASVASTTKTSFDQISVGSYMAYRNGPLTADLQFRYDDTEYKINDVAKTGYSDLGLDDAKFDSNTFTVSGRLNYSFQLENNFSFVPTVGLNLSRTSNSSIEFTNGEELFVDDYNTAIGFIGGTLSKAMFADSGTSATIFFGSLNYYNDFSDDRDSTFVDVDGNADTITTDAIGGFGEVSLGLNHVSLTGGDSFTARQLTASVRVDGRFGNNVEDSYGITGQIRLTF